MRTTDFSKWNDQELALGEQLETNGGSYVTTVYSPTWDAFVAYMKFTMATGGDYVIHHAQ